MPRLDGTGPRREGPRTGRGRGHCAPAQGADTNVVYGIGRGGRPRGGGRGRGRDGWNQ